jgi:hypothetical protein
VKSNVNSRDTSDEQEKTMKKTAILIPLLALLVVIGLVGCSSSDNSTNSNTPPAAPSSITASQTQRDVVVVGWSDVATEDSFAVQRSNDNSSWQNLAGTAANVISYNDGSILANRKYWYRVRAINTYGSSDFTTSGMYWTWPAAFDFSTDQTGNFHAFSIDGPPNYHTWTWDQNAQAGKLTITTPAVGQALTSVVADDSMPNQGWFESKLKIGAWHTGQVPSEVGVFVEQDPNVTNNTVGLIFSHDSLRFGYYSTGAGGDTMIRLVSGVNNIINENTWYTIRFFHQGFNWRVDVGGQLIFDGAISNVATGNYGLYQEWQFDRGNGPANQAFWLDDVANRGAVPTSLGADGNATSRSRLFIRPVAKK